MVEYFFDLSKKDQREALEYGRAETGRPVHLLEKDVWVVWTLRALFDAPLAADLTPRFHFGQVPHAAARRQVEATRKFTTALHFVDRRFGQGNDLPQFLATDGAPEGKGTLRKLRQRLVGFRSRQGKRIGRLR